MSSTPSNGSEFLSDETPSVDRLATAHSHPVIVDLGKTKRSDIQALKRGEGMLMAEVSRVIDEVRRNMADELAGKYLLPVVILYKGKRKRRPTLDPLG